MLRAVLGTLGGGARVPTLSLAVVAVGVRAATVAVVHPADGGGENLIEKDACELTRAPISARCTDDHRPQPSNPWKPSLGGGPIDASQINPRSPYSP